MLTWKEFREICRAGSASLLSKLIQIPKIDKIQLSGDLFIQQIRSPDNPIANVLVLRGGAFHMGDEGFYVKLTSYLLSDYRIFLFEKARPIITFDHSQDINTCIKWIKSHYPEKLILTGFSIGGILIWNYLSQGHDLADMYVPISAPFNLINFNQDVHQKFIYQRMCHQAIKFIGARDEKDLVRFGGYDLLTREKYMREFIPALQSTQAIWIDKTFPISGSEDTLFDRYLDDLKKFSGNIKAVVVQGGSHCCLDVVFHACYLIKIAMESGFQGYSLLKKYRASLQLLEDSLY